MAPVGAQNHDFTLLDLKIKFNEHKDSDQNLALFHLRPILSH